MHVLRLSEFNNKTMHVSPLSYKIGACKIFVKKFSAKNKQIFEFGLANPAPKLKKRKTKMNHGKNNSGPNEARRPS